MQNKEDGEEVELTNKIAETGTFFEKEKKAKNSYLCAVVVDVYKDLKYFILWVRKTWQKLVGRDSGVFECVSL